MKEFVNALLREVELKNSWGKNEMVMLIKTVQIAELERRLKQKEES